MSDPTHTTISKEGTMEMVRRNKYVIVMIIAMLLAVGGCVTTSDKPVSWQANTVTAYEATGASLTAAYNIGESLKAQGRLTGDKVAKFDEAYKRAYNIYQSLGKILINVITATKAEDRENAQAAYQQLYIDFPGALNEVLKIIKEVS